jgi:hypothetical protein
MVSPTTLSLYGDNLAGQWVVSPSTQETPRGKLAGIRTGG